jgi:hypothetical protein
LREETGARRVGFLVTVRSIPRRVLWPLLVIPLVSTVLSVGLLVLLWPRLVSELSELRWRLRPPLESERDVSDLEPEAVRRALDAWAADHGGQYPASLELLFLPDERGVTYLPPAPEQAAPR